MTEGINVGSVYADVLPDARQFNTRMAEIARNVAVAVKVDADTTAAQAKIKDVTKDDTKKVKVEADTSDAEAKAKAGGDRAGGAFADSFKARLKAAMASLPPIQIGAASSEAEQKLRDIRVELERLSGKTIGVDISDTEALAKMAELKARLDELGAESSSAQIKVDTAKASAELEKIQVQVDKLNGETAEVKVDADTAGADAKLKATGDSASGAGGGLGAMATAALTLGPALLPVGAAALGVASALATLGAAGVAGFGVFTLGIAGVTNAVKLLGQQQTQEAAAAQQAGQSAAAHAQAIVAAQRQIQSAQMSLADAQRSAADQQIQDSQAVQSAQYALAQADQQETNAVNALVNAREAAARQLESYANQAVDARLAEQQAVIDLQNAQQNYNTTMASQTATQVQREQAALDLQKAQQRIIETQQAATNATQDNNKAQQLGVNGAPQVVSATQAVAAAQHNQQQAAQNLADAQRKAAEDQIKSQESIVRAQQGVAAAMDAMATAQRNAAGSTNASLAATNAQIAKLDPATRSFAEYIRGTLTPVWHGLQSTVAAGMFPGLQAGIQNLMPDLPLLTTFLHNVATTLGELFQAAGKALTSPFWQNFFQTLNSQVGPALSALGHILGNVITGFAGLFQAFLPIINLVIPWLVTLSQKFADFGMQASSSSGFGKFIAYIQAAMPQVVQLLSGLFTFIGHVLQALAPIGPPLLSILNAIIGLLNKIPTNVLTMIAVGIMGIVTAQKLISPLSSLFGALSSMGPVTLAIAAIAGAFLLVYTNSKTFRDFIANQVVPTLKEWGDWIMKNVVPALQALWDWITHKLVPILAGIFMDAWHGIQDAVQWVSKVISDNRGELKQLWDVISAVVGFIVQYVVPIVGTILKTAFDVVGIAIGVVIKIVGTLIDIWNTMWQVGKDIGHWFATDFVGFFVGVWNTIRDGWKTLVQDVANLWQNIEHYVMVPVAWVVRYIINDGLIKAWDWISDHLLGGLLHATPMDVPAVPPLAAATGGVVPGYAPGRDSVNAILSPGEGILVPEAVRGIGGAPAVHALNAAFSSRVPGPSMKHGLPGFDGGGIWESILGTVGEAVNPGLQGEADVLHKSPAQLGQMLSDPIGGITQLIQSIMKGIGQAGPFIEMLGDMGLGLAKGVGQAILNLIIPGTGGQGYRQYLDGFSAAQLQNAGAAGGINLGNLGNLSNLSALGRAGAVQAVMAIASQYGWGSGPEWNALDAVIMRESGFNPTAQNPTSSAYGIFQFLDSTWASYGVPKTSDALQQSVAGMRYIASRYHDPLGALAHEQAFGWYDWGGAIDPGYHLIYNGTGQQELIAPKQTFQQIMSGASGGSAGPRQVFLQLDGAATTALLDGKVTQGLEQVYNWTGA